MIREYTYMEHFKMEYFKCLVNNEYIEKLNRDREEQKRIDREHRHRLYDQLDILHASGNAKYSGKEFEMIMAANSGKLDDMIDMVKRGYEVYGRILIQASMYGRLNIIKYLIELGISNGINDALISAASGGHYDIVQYLLENGADIHHMNDSPLLRSISGKHWDIARYLILNGANVHVDDDAVSKYFDALENEEIKDHVLLGG